MNPALIRAILLLTLLAVLALTAHRWLPWLASLTDHHPPKDAQGSSAEGDTQSGQARFNHNGGEHSHQAGTQ